MHSDFIVIGLTGGIASGKSTVAAFLRDAKVPVLDADQLGRMVLEQGTDTYNQVVCAFGEDILDINGNIDRQALGAQVFDKKEARILLESITHPAIASLAKQGLSLIAARGEPMAFYEAALLVETGIYKGLEALVVVSCSVKTQLERLTVRDKLLQSAAAARIASQYPLEEKVKAADYVINTEGTLKETQERTLEVLAAIKERFLNN